MDDSEFKYGDRATAILYGNIKDRARRMTKEDKSHFIKYIQRYLDYTSALDMQSKYGTPGPERFVEEIPSKDDMLLYRFFLSEPQIKTAQPHPESKSTRGSDFTLGMDTHRRLPDDMQGIIGQFAGPEHATLLRQRRTVRDDRGESQVFVPGQRRKGWCPEGASCNIMGGITKFRKNKRHKRKTHRRRK